MTANQVKSLSDMIVARNVLQQKIKRLITEFEAEYTVSVDSIQLTYGERTGYGRFTMQVDIEVHLP